MRVGTGRPLLPCLPKRTLRLFPGDSRQGAVELSSDPVPRQYRKHRGGNAGRIGDTEEGRIEVSRRPNTFWKYAALPLAADLAKISVIRHHKLVSITLIDAIEGNRSRWYLHRRAAGRSHR